MMCISKLLHKDGIKKRERNIKTEDSYGFLHVSQQVTVGNSGLTRVWYSYEKQDIAKSVTALYFWHNKLVCSMDFLSYIYRVYRIGEEDIENIFIEEIKQYNLDKIQLVIDDETRG